MKLRFPRIPNDDPALEHEFRRARRRERLKIISSLREKYAEELRTASWWKRCLISLRIRLEADRTIRHRLYSAHAPPALGNAQAA